MNAVERIEKSDMDLMNDQQVKREADRAQVNTDELTERIAQAIGHDGTVEPLKGLQLQPRIQAAVWGATNARCGAAARSC